MFDPVTGNVAVMAPGGLANIAFQSHHLIAAQLESMSCLPAPAGPLVAKLGLWFKEEEITPTFAIFPAGAPESETALFVFTATDSHVSPSKCAESFAKIPSLRTIVVVQFALPTKVDTESQMVRLTEKSLASVFTKVDGKIEPAVHRESLSTPGGAIQLWLSDIVEQEDVNKLPAEFIRGQ
jgi:hypothetical protein